MKLKEIEQISNDFENNVIVCRPTLLQLVERAKNLSTEPDWGAAQKISNVSPVHEALAVFSEDPTENNGIGVILQVIKAFQAA